MSLVIILGERCGVQPSAAYKKVEGVPSVHHFPKKSQKTRVYPLHPHLPTYGLTHINAHGKGRDCLYFESLLNKF